MSRVEERKPFVVAEGGGGVGKTTAIEGLKPHLEGFEFFREPGGTPFGEAMREAVQQNMDWEIDPLASLFAYNASRANLVKTQILPILEHVVPARGVFLDRYWFSTYAYQGSEKISPDLILSLSRLATGGLMPDLVLHFDLAPELAMLRKGKCLDIDRYDLRELDFHRRVRDAYLELSVKYADIWRIIDTSVSPELVVAQALAALREKEII